jgi:phosphatidylglycerol:prolipoprotein diacylglycerol transferase
MCGFALATQLFIKKIQQIISDERHHYFFKEEFPIGALIFMSIGARLGHFILYGHIKKIAFYHMLAIWKGGVSLHGGVIGVLIYAYLIAYWKKIHFLHILDAVSYASPVGIMMGRIGNFINQELVGKITQQPWGVSFPLYDYSFGVMRHPSQLYESFLEGPMTFFLAYMLTKNNKAKGLVTGWIWFFYSMARFFCEFYREFTDAPFVYGRFVFSWGQIYSLPLLVLALIILVKQYFFSGKSEKQYQLALV